MEFLVQVDVVHDRIFNLYSTLVCVARCNKQLQSNKVAWSCAVVDLHSNNDNDVCSKLLIKTKLIFDSKNYKKLLRISNNPFFFQMKN